eukprot:g14534.t1 g14534   contig9:2076053-2079490(+)
MEFKTDYGEELSEQQYRDRTHEAEGDSSDDESIDREEMNENVRRSPEETYGADVCNKSIKSSASMYSTSSRMWLKRERIFGYRSRSFALSKVGRKKNLPCPSNQVASHHLFAHLRILAGTKILSFSDDTWLSDQVELGLLRKGGDFKSARFETNIEGVGVYLMDDYPKELMGIVVRDIQLYKPVGSIKATARVRHFQVDAMLPDARYPIIIQPLPLGVDRRESSIESDEVTDIVSNGDCFWMKQDEKPVPVLEVTGSYVPQTNMTWVPSLDLFISPMKLQIDLDYILRVIGVVLNSVSKYQDNLAKPSVATSNANDKLAYATRGQMNFCLTYIEELFIAPVYFELELDIKPEDAEYDGAESDEAALTLNAIARSTNSAVAAGILGWIINVGANFAHVSPTFKYSSLSDSDRYCDIVDLGKDIAISYIVQTIQQSYKVIFSMHLLGDPSLLAHQVKTGVSDLVFKTRDEVAAGGRDGIGKGAASFVQNVVGGGFTAVSKISSGVAKTIDSVTTNDLTSTHLKPMLASHRQRPTDALDGIVKGTKFLGKTLIFGIAGLIGNPYRGVKTRTITGVTKGVASGLGGLIASPIVGALGFIAKASDGAGATTKYLELGVIESRCRPARVVSWGKPMCEHGISYLKAVGIRVHTVRYRKIRKRVDKQINEDQSDHLVQETWQSSKEYKRNKAAEERRKNPPSKVVTIFYKKEKQHHATVANKPKLLSDQPLNDVISHYAVTFEETIILRVSDMQLSDQVTIELRNNRLIKSASQPLAVCRLTVGDIYASILHYYNEQITLKEATLSQDTINNSSNLFSDNAGMQTASVGTSSNKKPFIIPSPQEYALFRPIKKVAPQIDIFDDINEELSSIQKVFEEESSKNVDSDTFHSDSDASFLGKRTSVKREDKANFAKANERLFGSISLSFFPVPW